MNGDIREKIKLACIEAFNGKGCRFTLDDVAKLLHISKKTIYRWYESKEAILETILLETFDDVHEKQRVIYENPAWGTREKLTRLLTAESKYERAIDMKRLSEVQEVYPRLHALMLQKYTTEWGLALALLERGVQEGVFRPVNVHLVQRLLQEGMQTMHRDGFLERSGMSYWEGVSQMVEIILDGIAAR